MRKYAAATALAALICLAAAASACEINWGTTQAVNEGYWDLTKNGSASYCSTQSLYSQNVLQCCIPNPYAVGNATGASGKVGILSLAGQFNYTVSVVPLSVAENAYTVLGLTNYTESGAGPQHDFINTTYIVKVLFHHNAGFKQIIVNGSNPTACTGQFFNRVLEGGTSGNLTLNFESNLLDGLIEISFNNNTGWHNIVNCSYQGSDIQYSPVFGILSLAGGAYPDNCAELYYAEAISNNSYLQTFQAYDAISDYAIPNCTITPSPTICEGVGDGRPCSGGSAHYDPVNLTTDYAGLTDSMTLNSACDMIDAPYHTVYEATAECEGYNTLTNMFYANSLEDNYIKEFAMISSENNTRTCNVRFNITDSVTNQPITAAQIDLKSIYHTTQTRYTGTDGLVTFPNVDSTVTYSLEISKLGYVSRSVTDMPGLGVDNICYTFLGLNQYHIALTPTNTSTTQIDVIVDANGNSYQLGNVKTYLFQCPIYYTGHDLNYLQNTCENLVGPSQPIWPSGVYYENNIEYIYPSIAGTLNLTGRKITMPNINVVASYTPDDGPTVYAIQVRGISGITGGKIGFALTFPLPANVTVPVNVYAQGTSNRVNVSLYIYDTYDATQFYNGYSDYETKQINIRESGESLTARVRDTSGAYYNTEIRWQQQTPWDIYLMPTQNGSNITLRYQMEGYLLDNNKNQLQSYGNFRLTLNRFDGSGTCANEGTGVTVNGSGYYIFTGIPQSFDCLLLTSQYPGDYQEAQYRTGGFYNNVTYNLTVYYNNQTPPTTLPPTSSRTLLINSVDGSGSALTGVKVKLTGCGYSYSPVTDATGQTTQTLKYCKGGYSWIATKAGYVQDSGTVSWPESGEEFDLTVALQAESGTGPGQPGTCVIYGYFKIINGTDRQNLPFYTGNLYNEDGTFTGEYITADATGYYEKNVRCNSVYKITAERDTLTFEEIVTVGESGRFNLNIVFEYAADRRSGDKASFVDFLWSLLGIFQAIIFLFFIMVLVGIASKIGKF